MLDWLSEAARLQEKMIDDRRIIHRNAEVGFELDKTVAFISKWLTEIGLIPKRVGKCGLVAELGEKDGKCIMLRADMDALPIKEESNEEFASKNGKMHACGHDIHSAMLLGAAEILMKNADKIRGRILFCFQGAEEILSGAKDMIDSGVLSDYSPDMALMIHTLVGVPLERGTVVVSSAGVGAASADFFRINIQGASAHGATPYLAKDALFCAVQIYNAIYSIVMREISIDDGVVLSVGTLNSKGAGNVISDMATIEGSIRSFSDSARARVVEKIYQYSDKIAEMYGMKCNVDFYSGCPTLINDADMSTRAYACVKKLIGSKCKFTDELGGRSGGSEDFSYFSHRIPSLMIGVVAGSSYDGFEVTAHNPRVRYDESALSLGAAVYAACAFEMIKE